VVATAAIPIGPARAASDDDLAFANFAVSVELLLADFYGRALAGQALSGASAKAMRRGRSAAVQYVRALGDLLVGAGQTAPEPEDFAFEWPARTFATAPAVASTALGVLRPLLGAYQTAAASVTEMSHRILYTSLTASVAGQIGTHAALAGRVYPPPFPVAVDLETASASLETYLG
jgi:hypothetical protein